MTDIFKYIKTLLIVLGVGILAVITSCKRDLDSVWINSGNLSVVQWLDSHEDMSLFAEALHTTGLYNRLGARGTFTVFAPNNSAMEQLYSANAGLRTDVEELTELVNYHLLMRENDTEDFNRGGFVNDTTINGLNVAVNFGDAVYTVNGRADIVEPDIDLTNAKLHVIDEVLTIPDQSLYQVVNDPNYSIFKSGIDQNPDLVEILSTVENDSIHASTMIAVSDAGISLDEEAALKRYIGYHILPQGGENKYGYILMGEMTNTVYRCMTDELDFVIGNYTNQGQALINSYPHENPELNIPGTELDKELSNFLHANGVIHVAKTPLEVITTATLDEWGGTYEIVREFEYNYYSYWDELEEIRVRGFYENAGVRYEGLELTGSWWNSVLDEGGPAFINESNVPGWFEADINNVVPGKNYEFHYKGQGFNYSYVFVYLYPTDEAELYEADPYKYKLKDGESEVSIHAEKGRFEYPGEPKDYVFTKELTKRYYKIRFEVRGKNNFRPGQLVLKPVSD
jgi:uncharacterized surface protein with fasciclin (FAS1) repeats